MHWGTRDNIKEDAAMKTRALGSATLVAMLALAAALAFGPVTARAEDAAGKAYASAAAAPAATSGAARPSPRGSSSSRPSG